jgi:PEP-CTERM motif
LAQSELYKEGRMRKIGTIASVVAFAATLSIGVPSSFAVVNYSITFDFFLNNSSPTLTGETFTFSKDVPDFLSVGETLTYDSITQISSTSGTVATYPNQLVLTQNLVGITSDIAGVTFNPPLGTLLGGATSINPFGPIGAAVPPASACLPDMPCTGQTGSLSGLVVFATGGQDSRNATYVLVVSGTPDNGNGVVPEPASLLLAATGLAGLAARRLRRRARRTGDIG